MTCISIGIVGRQQRELVETNSESFIIPYSVQFLRRVGAVASEHAFVCYYYITRSPRVDFSCVTQKYGHEKHKV